MEARNFMSTNLVTCKPSDTVEDAARTMLEHNHSVVPVVDNKNSIVGIVTESDFVGKKVTAPHAMSSLKQLFGSTFHAQDVEEIYASSKQKKLEDVMSKDIVKISADSSLSEVVDLMHRKNIKRLPVVENDKLVGLITRRDLIKVFVNTQESEIRP